MNESLFSPINKSPIVVNQYTGWAVSRAPRNYVECNVKQCKINGVEYLFLSFDV